MPPNSRKNYAKKDVYKRQGKVLREEQVSNHQQAVARLIGALKNDLEMDNEPVSYTHLDVYKRQSSHIRFSPCLSPSSG